MRHADSVISKKFSSLSFNGKNFTNSASYMYNTMIAFNEIIPPNGPFEFFFEKDLNIYKVSWKKLNNDVDLKRDIEVFGNGFCGSKNIYCRWSFGKYNDEYAIGNILV